MLVWLRHDRTIPERVIVNVDDLQIVSKKTEVPFRVLEYSSRSKTLANPIARRPLTHTKGYSGVRDGDDSFHLDDDLFSSKKRKGRKEGHNIFFSKRRDNVSGSKSIFESAVERFSHEMPHLSSR